MPYDPTLHRRRSIRLLDYDYAAPGWYFVTICVQHRACLLSAVDGEFVRLAPAAVMANASWHRLPDKFPHVRLDAFVVMPNHVHGIIGLTYAVANAGGNADPNGDTITNDGGTVTDDGGTVTNDGVGAAPRVRPTARPVALSDQGAYVGAPLPQVIQWWKTMTTNAYIRGVKAHAWPPFDGRLWQRNYWERVVRDERELDLARHYIAENPLRWHLDRLHPDRRPW